MFVGAHILLHYALAQETGRKGLVVTVHPSGKPFLDFPGAPHFSLSHCPGMAVCAVSPLAPVGADVEDVTRSPADAAMAETVFCSEERAWFGGARDRFFRIWTMKEAVFKSANEIWSDRWRQFSVMPALTGAGWPGLATEQREIEPNLLAAIARSGSEPLNAEWKRVSREDLQR